MDKKIVMFCLCALIAIFVIPSVIFAASFDCSKASTKTEKAICDDPILSKLDEDMAAAYSKALTTSDRDTVRKGQRKWLKAILAPCIEDKICIKKAYENRLRQLESKEALSANRKSRTMAKRDITETQVTALNVTSDGTRVVTGNENGSINIWKKDNLSMLLAIPGHRHRTQQVMLSPDDRYIVSYSDSDSDVNVWELPSGRLVHTYRLGVGIHHKIIFNKKGTVLIIAPSSQGIIAVPFKIGKRYSVTTSDEAIWSMKVDEDAKYLRVIALSPDKEVLATALNGYEDSIFIVHLWKCSQGIWDKKEEMERITTIRQAMKPKDRIDQVAITNNGRYLLAGTHFGLVYVYDIGRNPAQLVRTIETSSNGGMYSLVITGDDTTIITSGGTNNWNGEDGAGVVDVWDIKTGKRIYKLANLGSWPLVTLQGNSLIFGSSHRLWVEDIKTGKKTLMHPRQKDGAVSTLAISKSKTIMVSAGWDNRIVNIWSIPSFGLKMSVPTRHNYYTARISPDDKSVVLGSFDGTIVVMDLQSGSIIREIQAHANFKPGTIFVSPDSKCIIGLQPPSIKKVFQISDGKEVTDNSVCNIPLGRVIAQSENDYIVAADKVNDGNDKITVHSLVGRALWEVDLSPYNYAWTGDSALFSPDGQYVFFALRTGYNKLGAIIQFNRDSGQRIREMETASCCVLAANKKYLISGGDDKRAVIWDIATGKQIHRLYGHQDGIRSIQIVDDIAITAASDGQIFVWSLPEGKLSKILRHQ